MSTLDIDFNDFIAYRIGDVDEEDKRIRSLYDGLSEGVQEIASQIEGLATHRAYKIGFLDGIRLMAGL